MKKNRIMRGILTTTSTAIATAVVSPIIDTCVKTISDKMTYTIDLTNAEMYMSSGIKKYFKNIPDRLLIETSSAYKDGFNMEFIKNISAWDISTANYIETIFWKGIPITLKAESKRTSEDNGPMSNPLTLSTLNTKKCKKYLKKFLHVLTKEQHKEDIVKSQNMIMLYGLNDRNVGIVKGLSNYRKRTFENTFIPHEQEMLIKNSIDKFINNRDWYIQNNIPYHFGFLLYGDGGTGKSSIAQAIADYAHAQLICLPGDKVGDLPHLLSGLIPNTTSDKSLYRVILIEDIDCGFAERSMKTTYDYDKNEFRNVDRKIGLASILNCLDGILAPENTIYVFTTNHIEKLDPALIRPGRCDVKLDIKGVNKETFVRFCQFHYRDFYAGDIEIPEIKEGITFAELQTEVMRGATVQDLCDLIRVDKERPNENN